MIGLRMVLCDRSHQNVIENTQGINIGYNDHDEQQQSKQMIKTQ